MQLLLLCWLQERDPFKLFGYFVFAFCGTYQPLISAWCSQCLQEEVGIDFPDKKKLHTYFSTVSKSIRCCLRNELGRNECCISKGSDF